ncbi:UNVERIFIED_CONTAM: hypothetical protein O8I53_06200 [Campylobacter lari]
MQNETGNAINGTAANNFNYDGIQKVALNYNASIAANDNDPISGLFGIMKDTEGHKTNEIIFDNYQN